MNLTRNEFVESVYRLAQPGGETHGVGLLDHDAAQRAEMERLHLQIDNLASWILANVPGEPAQSQGACETAMRLIATLQADLAACRARLASYQSSPDIPPDDRGDKEVV